MNDKRFCYIEPSNCIYDMKTDTMYFLGDIKNIYALLDLINKQIYGLQHRLEVAEIATKLACENISCIDCEHFDCRKEYNETHTCLDCSLLNLANEHLSDYFRKQAEKELKGEE